MNTIEKIQNEIDGMEYWDAKVLDFGSKYFGDVVELVIEDDKEHAYKVTFKGCFDVSYTNNYTRESDRKVKDMSLLQLGYYAHDITVSEVADTNFYKVDLALPMLFCVVQCKSINVEKIDMESFSFF